MDKYKLKKKFHRLKNGDFINLQENDTINLFENLKTNLDIDFRIFYIIAISDTMCKREGDLFD